MKKFHLSKGEAEWFYDSIHLGLDEIYQVVERKELPYGVQFILHNHVIVNVYDTMKYLIQGSGRKQGRVELNINNLFVKFQRGREIDQRWYSFARENNLPSEAFQIY